LNQLKERLVQLLSITDKEAQHLEGVTQRLLSILPDNEEQLKEKLNDPQLIDTLESFSAKFARMQDTIADKLLPVFLKMAGEQTGTVIENLNRAEKLFLITNAQVWLMARGIRNQLVHEYIENAHELLEAVNLARQFVSELIKTQKTIKSYAYKQLNLK